MEFLYVVKCMFDFMVEEIIKNGNVEKIVIEYIDF